MSATNDASETPLERRQGDRLAALRPEPDTEPRLLTREDVDRRIGTPRAGKGRRALRRIFFAVVILAILAAGSIIAGAIWSRHVMRAVLPAIDGTLPVDGLHAPVTVTRN